MLELAPASHGVTEAGRRAFARWTDLLARALTGSGVGAEHARRLATLAITSLEGALVLARVTQDAAPVTDAVTDVAALFDAAAT